MPTDTERLDFIETITRKRSITGVSFDWIPSVDGERSGFRFMRRHYIGGAKATLRDTIDAEIAMEKS
jgi:hypothetical protein